MKEHFSALELFVLTLVGTGTLPATAYEDFVDFLMLPHAPPDPVPGEEFAPAELPPDVQQVVRKSIEEIARDNPKREAQVKHIPTNDKERRLSELRMIVVRQLVALRDHGCEIRAEVIEE